MPSESTTEAAGAAGAAGASATGADAAGVDGSPGLDTLPSAARRVLDSIFGGLPANLSPQEIVNAVVPQAVRDTIAQAFASGPAVAADVLGVLF